MIVQNSKCEGYEWSGSVWYFYTYSNPVSLPTFISPDHILVNKLKIRKRLSRRLEQMIFYFYYYFIPGLTTIATAVWIVEVTLMLQFVETELDL